MATVDDSCEPVWVRAEDPLLIIYSSGSTGKPKGVVLTSGGYMVYTYVNFKYVFNCTQGDVVFSPINLGWVVEQRFSVYGSLANGATIVIMEGLLTHPDPSRIWRIIEKHKVNIYFSPPDCIRAHMLLGEQYITPYQRDSLKVLASAGDILSPELWHWYYDVIRGGKCPVVNFYGQTETSGSMLTSFPTFISSKPGSVGLPFFGVDAAVMDDNGRELQGEATGNLVFKRPWPGIIRTINDNQELYEKTYFNKFIGYYWTRDQVYRDSEGYYWIKARSDDSLKVSGLLISLAEVEKTIVVDRAVAEASAVSSPHPIKDHCIHVFVVLNKGFQLNEELINTLKNRVRSEIGEMAVPDQLYSMSSLPKTISGKVVKRILASKASGDNDMGDTSTLDDDSILNELSRLNIIKT